MKTGIACALLAAAVLLGCGSNKKIEYDVYRIKKSSAADKAVINCKGGKFRDGKPTEIRIMGNITNVEIKNCHINGAIRTVGLGMNGESHDVRDSSRSRGHTKRAQMAAPSYVSIDNVTINGIGRVPLYVGPGTTHLSLTNSKLTGDTRVGAIYLDAESAHNVIDSNVFDTEGEWTVRQFRIREVISVDGSASNVITRNKFKNPEGGGVYVYRNCGEGGTVRHLKPEHNIISKNVFDLTRMKGDNYAIILGARQGKRHYCGMDKGYPFGSSANDMDFADNNYVQANEFIGSDRGVKDNGSNNVVD